MATVICNAEIFTCVHLMFYQEKHMCMGKTSSSNGQPDFIKWAKLFYLMGRTEVLPKPRFTLKL